MRFISEQSRLWPPEYCHPALCWTWVTDNLKPVLCSGLSDLPKEFHNPFPAVTTWHILPSVEWYFHNACKETNMRFVGKAKMDENTGRKWETHWRFEGTLLSLWSFWEDWELDEKFKDPAPSPQASGLGVSQLQGDILRAWPWKDRWGSLLAKHWSSKWNKDGEIFPFACSRSVFAADLKKTKASFKCSRLVTNILMVSHFFMTPLTHPQGWQSLTSKWWYWIQEWKAKGRKKV